MSKWNNLTDEELLQQLHDILSELYALRVNKVTDVVRKHHEFKKYRRDVARILTLLNQRKNKKGEKDEKTN